MKWLLAVLALTFLVVSSAAGDDAIVNGNFELGNTGFSTGYLYSPGNIWPEGTYDIVTNPSSAHPSASSYGDHTSGSGLMMAGNGSANGNTVIWSETVAVEEYSMYSLSVWISSWYPASPAILDVLFDGVVVGNITAPEEAGVWAECVVSWDSELASTVTISIVDRNDIALGNDFALDDISMMQVPTAVQATTWGRIKGMYK